MQTRSVRAAATIVLGVGLAAAGSPASMAAPTAPTTPAPTIGTVSVRGGHAAFVSPSGNVSCLMSKTGRNPTDVRCEIREHAWKGPKRPRWCELDWGPAVDLGGLMCVSDTIGLPTLGDAEREGWFTPRVGMPVKRMGFYMAGLRYGYALRVGDATCASTKTGITCTDRRRHGFTVSRTVLRTF